MLPLPERIVFLLAVVASLAATAFAIRRLVRILGAGQGRPDWRLAWNRLPATILRIVTFRPVFRSRFWTSLFHALVGWGFGFYILVNLIDVLWRIVPGFTLPGGWLVDVYRLLADLLTAAVLIGMAFLVLRRFVFRPANLSARETTLLHPKARAGIRRDSAIVAAFIIVHVGARLVGESLSLALPILGKAPLLGMALDGWEPVASALAWFWYRLSFVPALGPVALPAARIGIHLAFWLSIGTILAFLPYFPYSKHVHLFFAPLNFLLKPDRRSMGEMRHLDLDDPSIEHFGAAKLADLGWEQLMDAYACIMCYRCQDACPAYQTGKVLSPAALEINKRYLLNEVAAFRPAILPGSPLTASVITPEAVWACTACGACVDICPVGNEPMRDILDIRRNLTLMENAFPKQLETSFRNMERSANPWGVPASERLKWAEGLSVPTVEQNPAADLLWWVGCAPATDPRAQKVARAFARILQAAGVDYAVLGPREQCTGDSARRAGREDVFFALAQANVETLNSAAPGRIVTTCPHCLHVLKNEYPAFGGNYEVIHHTQLIAELLAAGRLPLDSGGLPPGLQPRTNHEPPPGIQSQIPLQTGDLPPELQEQAPGVQSGYITFHDPCYLGRQNGVFESPRAAILAAGSDLAEMPRHGRKSFCCGAGGAQMWKEEEAGTERVSAARLAEARATGAGTLAVGCPFCLTMLTDAAKADGADGLQVLDVAEVVAARLA